MRFATPFAAIAFLAGLLALGSPAHAQTKENLRKLSEAYKLLEDDKTAEAIKQLDAVIEDTPEDTDAASKAMLLRGQAYAKGGRHAQALADFNAALWLQGLSSSQRKDAVEGRKAALAKLGLSDGEPAASDTAEKPETTASPQPAPTARAQQPAQRPGPESWQTEVQAAEQKEESGGLGSFFSGLFGGDSEQPEDQTASVSPPSAPSAASGWATSTAAVDEPSAAAPADGGQYRVQIASVGSREGAESEAQRLSRILGDAMAGESTDIVRTDTEAGNTYYRIMVGPKPSRDTAEEMCQMFKSRGVDCLVLSSR
jgi:hypothetical protein